ncbi:hypothetical protein IKF15_03495 [Candidatus Saccharibacteria bacterium]|nr:hypothetical protein [Candidatus Saccharibacteria bacterium]
MNTLTLVVYFSIASLLISACALALLRINSRFTDILKKYASSIAVLLAVVAVFAFILNDLVGLIPLSQLITVSLILVIVFAFVNHALSMLRRYLLSLYKQGRKKEKRRLAQLGVYAIDLAGGVMAGFVLGCSFLVSVASGIMVALSLSIFLLTRSFVFAERYRNRFKYSGRRLKIVLLAPLCLVPVVAIATYLVLSAQIGVAATYLTIAFAYLLYLAIWQFIFIVKNHQK